MNGNEMMRVGLATWGCDVDTAVLSYGQSCAIPGQMVLARVVSWCFGTVGLCTATIRVVTITNVRFSVGILSGQLMRHIGSARPNSRYLDLTRVKNISARQVFGSVGFESCGMFDRGWPEKTLAVLRLLTKIG